MLAPGCRDHICMTRGSWETFTVIQWVNSTCKQRAKTKDQSPHNLMYPSDSHMLTEIWDWSCDSTLVSPHREQKHPSTIMVLHWHPLQERTRLCVIFQLYQLRRNPLLNFYGLLKFGLDFYEKNKPITQAVTSNWITREAAQNPI